MKATTPSLLRRAEIHGLRLSDTAYAPATEIPPHEHEHAKVSLLLSGEVQESQGPAVSQPGLMSVAVKPAGSIHSDRFGPRGARLFSIRLCPAFVQSLGAASTSVQTYRWTQDHRAVHAALRAYREFVASGDVTSVEAVADLLATLATDEPDPPTWLVAARDRLHRSHAEPLTVGAVAEEVGVHRVYLARVWRARYGCSVRSYLRQVRVRAAAELITETDLGLASIANRTGFSDQAHLSRCFRKEMGVPPGQWRRGR